MRLINLDKESLLAEAKSLKDTLPELQEWDFDNKNDVIRFMLDTYFASLETAGAWANALAQEFTIATATARDNVIQHAIQLGYVPTNRVAAEVDIVITYNSPATNVTIPAHTIRVSAQGRDGKKVYYENKENVTLLTGQTTVSAPFIQGQTRTLEVSSRGTPFQVFTVVDNVVHDSISVTVDSVEWQETDTFAILDATAERYRLRMMNDEVHQVVFGDGTKGSIPGNEAEIVIKYLRGGGTTGNVSAEKITSIEVNPQPDYITEITNPVAAAGGANPESMESIRNSAIRIPRLNNRVVSRRDIEDFAEAYDGVARAHAMSNFHSPLVYVIPDGGGQPSSGLIEDLQTDLNQIVVMGYFVTILPPQYVSVDLRLRLILNPAYRRSEVETEVRAELEKILDPLHRGQNGIWLRGYGDPLKVSEVVGTVRNVQGVMAVEILSPVPTVGNDILVSVGLDQIISLTETSITLDTIVSKEHEATNNRSVKALFANPKYRTEE